MRVEGISRRVLVLAIVSMSVSSLEVMAQEGRDKDPLAGDWRVKMDFNGREWESILAFSRDREGKRRGQWISFWAASDLEDIEYEGGKLSFKQRRENRDGDIVISNFSGSIKDGKLTGTVSSERGERRVEGARVPDLPQAAGSWETRFTIGEREIINKLVVTDKEGKLAVDWQSERVEHEISDIHHQGGKLTFKTRSKLEEREWESTFEATFDGDEYSGLIKTDRGERPVKGKRLGAPLVGTWDIVISSERGDRKQRLRVLPDMSALFGATRVDKVELKDGNVAFKLSLDFGEQTFDMDFQAKVDGKKLSGEFTTARGTRQVTGVKATAKAVAAPQPTTL